MVFREPRKELIRLQVAAPVPQPPQVSPQQNGKLMSYPTAASSYLALELEKPTSPVLTVLGPFWVQTQITK